MVTIGIIGAMEEEVAILKSKVEIISVKEIVGVEFFMGKMSGKNVVIVRSGIGKVNAAICTQVLIDMYGVDYIINIGVAGAISKELNIGDVVISDDLVQHDFDLVGAGYEVGIIPRIKDSYFKADDELIHLAKQACQTTLQENACFVGRIATGDVFVSNMEQKQIISKRFKAYCVEMEGAAIAHTATLNRVPFVVIRSISDKADENANNSFDEFVEKSAKNASKVVENIIENL